MHGYTHLQNSLADQLVSMAYGTELAFIGFHRLCTLMLVDRIQIIGHRYIAQMEWPRIVPHELCVYLLYVCYNSENKQQQQLHESTAFLRML